MTPDSVEPSRANRLAAETSPYLLQHAHNPVDWYPWGAQALERARLLDRPIFLSIGYAACHWCHVMERESFEDPATAADLNAGFVAIKVDREERPDVDELYMGAVQAMTGQGGWPMSVFLTPDGRPFFGGTYFPNRRRSSLPAFRDVLAGIAATWHERRADVEVTANRVAEAMAAQHARAAAGIDEAAAAASGLVGLDGRPLVAHHPVRPALEPELLEACVEEIERDFDEATGGWGGAPKFPQPMTIEVLLRQHLATAEELPLAIAGRTLHAMAAGGIYDQLGGGFARYATDAEWLVPHFEKMLYDNAQLARTYLHAWQVTGDPTFRRVVEETLDCLVRDFATAEGAFAASLDADTAGVEGGTYVWSAAELRAVLGAAAFELVAAAFDVTEAGNWEGRIILRRRAGDRELAEARGEPPAEIAARLAAARAELLAVRRTRAQPARDDKAVVAWNGLAIAAFAEASVALARPDYRAVAERTAGFLLHAAVGPGEQLHRTWKDGRPGPLGVLEDYADLAEGLLALYEATFDDRWFSAAVGLTERILTHFSDAGGGWFDTSDDAERLLVRPKGITDNATPSGNAMTATVLLRLAALTGDDRYRSAAERALGLVTGTVRRFPTAFAQWLAAISLAVRGIDEVAVVGDPDDAGTAALLGAVRSRYRPHAVLAWAPPGAAAASPVPLLHDRPLRGGRATAYVCRGFTCRQPVSSGPELAAQLGG